MLYFLAFIMVVVQCYSAVTDTTSILSTLKDNHRRNGTYAMLLNQTASVQNTLLGIEKIERGRFEAKPRYKRQQSSGAGKFTEAAQMPQLKVLRLFLTMFRNLWASSYTGGSNPFHPYVPKPIVKLFKQRIVEFFFPDVGVPSKV